MRRKPKMSEVSRDLKYASTPDLAQVGLLALIDEATGYQGVRPRDELRSMLRSYKKNRAKVPDIPVDK